MAVTTAGTNTQAATVGTEHTLFDTSAAGSYQLDVDCDAMVAGDVVEIRVYKMVRAGGTRRPYLFGSYRGLQPTDDKVQSTIPVSTPLSDSGALRFTLKQTKGTSRNFPWTVVSFI